MSTSQRVGRGFHRLLFLCAVCAASQSFAAQITDIQSKFSMLCVAEKGTGFNWKDNNWVQGNYRPYTYVLSKVDGHDESCLSWTGGEDFSRPITPPDGSAWGKSRGCYKLKEIGQKEEEIIPNSCGERWDKRNGGYVLKDVTCGGFSEEYRAAVDGPFALSRTYGVFMHAEEKDSVVLQIGKCSLLTGTPNEK